MLRECIRAEDPIGLQVKDLLKTGQLVPDELVNKLVQERIGRPDCEGGFILDGYPRTFSQAQTLVGLLDQFGIPQIVVHLQVDENKVVSRLTNRRLCPQCGTLYNVLLKPPIVQGRCDMEGARLIVREDDKEEVIRQRFEAYEKQSRPVLKFFESRGRLLIIEASDAEPESIAQRIGAHLRNGFGNGR